MNRSYLFLATGFEEIEALTVVDVMRRAGMDVKTVSITSVNEITGAHGITVKADLLFKDTDFNGAEWLILPGGLPGAEHLANCKPLGELLKRQAINGKIAAICASPAMVLGPLGIIDDREVTGYPGTEKLCGKALWKNSPVVALNRLVTGQGPSSALMFALAIVANSMGAVQAEAIGSAMLLYPAQPVKYY